MREDQSQRCHRHRSAADPVTFCYLASAAVYEDWAVVVVDASERQRPAPQPQTRPRCRLFLSSRALTEVMRTSSSGK
jgi:hypothetical protein